MNKILLFSDLHLHSHKQSLQRLEDCLQALRWVFQTARNRGLKDVVFLGDLFHDRQKIQVIVYHNVFKIFQEFGDLNVKILLGNHDLWFYDKWDISSVSPLAALSNVEVLDKPCTREISGLHFDFLPFTHNPVDKIASYFKKKSPVLCAHIAVDDAVLNKYHNTRSEVSVEIDKDVVKVGKEVFQGWDKVFLGHYHCAQRLNDRIEYVGSPLELSFNEAFQEKHIIILDPDSMATEYVVNDFSPKHIIVKEKDIEKVSLSNNFVQVEVDDISSHQIIDLRNKILETTKVNSIEFKEIKCKNFEFSHDELQDKFDIAHGDVLERFMKAKGIGNLDYDKLLKIGKDICYEN